MSPSYETRLRRVLQYIHDNPAGDLSLDQLADVAALSRFHFHRVYRTMTGETCADAVRRLRCHRASFWLTQTDWPLDRIATQAGYDNTQSFNRAFRAVFGQTPTAFRKTGSPRTATLTLTIGDTAMTQVDIRDIAPMRTATMPHKGPYQEISRAFQDLAAIFSARNLWPQMRGSIALYFDDPSSVPSADLRSVAGFAVTPETEMPSDLEEMTVGGMRCAVLRHHGPYTGLPMAWDALYSNWLPGSGETPADSPPFEIYLNDPTDTAPPDLLTDICVPLR